jgi:hypothetical protein
MSKGKPYGARASVQYPAQIDAGGDARVPCRLYDVSATGASIRVPSDRNIPDEFILLLAQSGAARRYCRVIRRDDNELRVQFERPHCEPPAKPKPHRHPPGVAAQQPDDVVKLDI